MKTKTFLLLCFIIGLAMTNLSAQIGEIEKNHSYSYTKPNVYSFFPVYCKNALVDTFHGYLDYHNIDHYKNGAGEWGINLCKGEFTSTTNNEIFRVNELDRYSIPINGTHSSNINMVGNDGTHYVISITWWNSGWDNFTVDKAVCIEDANK